jgi:TolB-like protein/Tfp pilus assembly protein PilF
MERLLRLARERRLDRVGAAYAVIAWAIVQGASIALPAFDVAPWVLRWVLVAAIAGFPLALGLAWHLSAESPPPTPIGHMRRWLLPGVLVIVLLALLVQLAAYWSRNGVSPGGEAGASSGQAAIAVLPFANLSGDPAKRYFSDGIADQLITELSRRRNLRVAARTSSFAFGGGSQDIKTIARALNVGAIVEGSVREDGNRVRIVAELINAADGFQIWSNSYDRDLTNILALQDDIARAISRALSEKLTGRDDAAPPPRAKLRIDPEAYRDYLQGRFYFAQRTPGGIRRSISLFEDVTRRAPGYADGFAMLGMAHVTVALNFTQNGELAPAAAAIGSALRLDPGNPIALMARATGSMVQWKWREAADDLLKVEAGNPGTPGLWHTKGVFLSYMGLTKFALPAIEKAVAQDPISFIDRYNLAVYQLNLGHRDEALVVAREGLDIQPGNFEGQELLCQVQAARGDLKDARRIGKELESSSSPDAVLPAVACSYYLAVAANDFRAVRAIADAVSAGFPSNGAGAVDIGIAYARAGDIEKALGWFERAYALREPQAPATRYTNPELKELFADPRWARFRDKPGFRDWEAARLEIAKRFQLGE